VVLTGAVFVGLASGSTALGLTDVLADVEGDLEAVSLLVADADWFAAPVRVELEVLPTPARFQVIPRSRTAAAAITHHRFHSGLAAGVAMRSKASTGTTARAGRTFTRARGATEGLVGWVAAGASGYPACPAPNVAIGNHARLVGSGSVWR
jgi:hypothetical protein